MAEGGQEVKGGVSKGGIIPGLEVLAKTATAYR